MSGSCFVHDSSQLVGVPQRNYLCVRVLVSVLVFVLLYHSSSFVFSFALVRTVDRPLDLLFILLPGGTYRGRVVL